MHILALRLCVETKHFAPHLWGVYSIKIELFVFLWHLRFSLLQYSFFCMWFNKLRLCRIVVCSFSKASNSPVCCNLLVRTNIQVRLLLDKFPHILHKCRILKDQIATWWWGHIAWCTVFHHFILLKMRVFNTIHYRMIFCQL